MTLTGDMETTSWQDNLPASKLRGVQLATALFALARLYAEAPSQDVVARFADPAMAATWPVRDEASLEALAQMGKASDMGCLKSEFATLIGPGGIVPMAESHYLGVDPLPLSQELARSYREEGYSSPKMATLPRDHVAVELGFLAHLVLGTQEDSGLEQVWHFREGHLDRFISDLLGCLEENATSVIRALVQLTRATLANLEEFTAGHE
ncbi:TorD/DmsD family molecular chaperone [Trueperella pecoris]|uniref:Molecular chaperone TorD family protein n=1 Tax=Trueperella pecoris TaxID=2733571 RepID=A0A7M1QWH3_9ACTO|nr:molecular chaperone TorD family protein [Trueperella pecoris]QOR46390.1 molecular chaperone TorD family protein [Trueperella pecoris]QTG76215.1 molecular chaperone TorD family protein [Trueperella pecoris]